MVKREFLTAALSGLMMLGCMLVAQNVVAQATEAPAGSAAKQDGSATKQDDKMASKEMKAKPVAVSVGDGAFTFQVPGQWKKKTPKFPNIILSEFEIPKTEGDARPGRMTISRSGGGIEQNIGRWERQFQQSSEADKKAFKKEMKSKEIAGHKTHLITLSGTYLDGSPMGPKTPRENYQMQGLIIETESGGNYFVKAYGSKKMMDANKGGLKRLFTEMNSSKKEMGSGKKEGSDKK